MSTCHRRTEPACLPRGRSRMLRASRLLFAGIAALACATTASADPKHYAIDPVHTRIVFAIDHLGFSTSLGTFSHPTGSLWLDPDDLATARVDVSIDIASLDLGDTDWRDRMFKRDYFDLARHATARFVSTSIEPTGDNRARVHGHLTLRGVTLPLVLDATLNKHGRHPLTFRTTAGFSATTTLQRSAFGMDDNLRTVGDSVELRIEVEASRERAERSRDETQARSDDDATDPNAPASGDTPTTHTRQPTTPHTGTEPA